MRIITFDNIQIYSGFNSVIQGMPDNPLMEIALTNVNQHVDGAFDFGQRRKPVGGSRTTQDERDELYVRKPVYFAIAHVNGLRIDGLTLSHLLYPVARQFDRGVAGLYDVDNAVIEGVRRMAGGKPFASPVVDLVETQPLSMVGLVDAGAPGSGVRR